MSDQRTAELEADIEAQREHLAETVDQLAHKLDVKAQVRERAAELKDRPQILAAGVGVVVLAGLLLWWRRR